MNTKLSFRLQWSKRAMALVVVAAPLQWAFASQAESALRTPVATQTATVVAQSDKTHSVKGRVFDELGEPLIGATISVEGTNVKTVTDIDGNFSISTQKAPASTMLRISYMGYKDKVVSGAANLNVTMQLDQQSIDEVVVTALGIKREKKMLGYSVQEVKADKLNVTGDPSVVGALDGKVAGLQMNTASTGLGGSTKITIRGNSSLTDNNQPLWIVDGVPFTDDQTSSASTYGGYDRGGTSFDIYPEDIESISVLKGPNAAALYGSRAGNGVILVTTKRGSHKQGFGVSYSGNFTWSQAAETLKMQKLYGQGSQGQFLFNEDENGNKNLNLEFLNYIFDEKAAEGENIDYLVYDLGVYLKSYDKINGTSCFTDYSNHYSENYADIVESTISGNAYLGTEANDSYSGTSKIDFIFGENGNDNLRGGNGNDAISGEQATISCTEIQAATYLLAAKAATLSTAEQVMTH